MPSQRLREVRLTVPLEMYEHVRAAAKKQGMTVREGFEALLVAGLQRRQPQALEHVIAVPEPEATQ